MRTVLFHTALLIFSLIEAAPAWLLSPLSNDTADVILAPQAVSGNTECAAASASTSLFLSFVSYGNYTAIPGQGGDELVPQQLMSMSFAVTNEANGIYTICAFPLGHSAPSTGAGSPATWIDDASWQACADRRDSDGKHRFTIATGASFRREDRFVSVNQTWFCHDDAGRLVAYTGIANGSLSMTCGDGGELGGYHVENCTSPDVELPVTLL
ncbi:hypothetical protein F5Y04DRAFT_281249 [Hypomontagnella monticulosa]|nr:hypothetical protein F5Y04DRAFT_281249 [Hypomontagnella monticulosa]